jgi:hypothetical protein
MVGVNVGQWPDATLTHPITSLPATIHSVCTNKHLGFVKDIIPKILLDSGFEYRVYNVFDGFGLCVAPMGMQ